MPLVRGANLGYGQLRPVRLVVLAFSLYSRCTSTTKSSVAARLGPGFAAMTFQDADYAPVVQTGLAPATSTKMVI